MRVYGLGVLPNCVGTSLTQDVEQYRVLLAEEQCSRQVPRRSCTRVQRCRVLYEPRWWRRWRVARAYECTVSLLPCINIINKQKTLKTSIAGFRE